MQILHLTQNLKKTKDEEDEINNIINKNEEKQIEKGKEKILNYIRNIINKKQ